MSHIDCGAESAAEVVVMLQIVFEALYPVFGTAFIVLGIIALIWLVVHVEHGRHFSKAKALFAVVLGSVLLGLGIHFMLLAAGL